VLRCYPPPRPKRAPRPVLLPLRMLPYVPKGQGTSLPALQ
jgi:hypothetical protein